jgi:hypothetical protein
VKGAVAVFRFTVPRSKSHYEVEYCCVTEGNKTGLFRQISGYHGEIKVDPASGTILRIAIQADLRDSFPITAADLSVEYGQVEIGGKNYICPLHSVAIVKAYTRAPDMGSEEPLYPCKGTRPDNIRDMPIQTMINDIAFRQYHLFRSESRILTTSDPAPQ